MEKTYIELVERVNKQKYLVNKNLITYVHKIEGNEWTDEACEIGIGIQVIFVDINYELLVKMLNN